MFNFFKKFLDYNQKQIIQYQKIVDEINFLDDKARKLKDEDFKKETSKLKEKISSGLPEVIKEVRPWAFALVREAARRVLGLRHYDVQIIAGLGLSDGKITEQKTGEGKTLSATTALYLHALTGKGVHLVTVNDYLARRDAGWMGGIFDFLGLTTSATISEKSFIYDAKFDDKDTSDWRLKHLRPVSRKEAYMADITYGINSEFGFDYLRDNMVQDSVELRQRGYYFAIIDEADSVLIDEARTPHIISAPNEEDTSRYYKYAQVVKKLSPEDYVVDEKERSANMTEKGLAKVEKMLGVENLYEKDFESVFHLEAALKAETLFKKEKDYIVKDGEIIIVDEFTGRLQYGRRWSEGIHQAVEAKENQPIQKESKTLATISLQNYFRKYSILAGMTGTAATEAEEFHKIYNCDILLVPTHNNMIRKDEADLIYKTEVGKFKAVVEEVAAVYKTGRPVLIGTTSIEKNELLSRMLQQRGVQHNVLNAKNHEHEAQIIAAAGKLNAVTVATNMAGRGVDIILGGDPDANLKTKEKDKKKGWEDEHKKVLELGGLYIIGTERHESRRIDNQLRGRAGRQGDPGESRFFVSLEDDLMRIFGGEQIAKLMTFFNLPEDQPLTHSMVTKAIEQAQVKVEGRNFDIRKNTVEYDDVLNKQREIIYDLRREILKETDRNPEKFRETILAVVNEQLEFHANMINYEQDSNVEEMNANVIKELQLLLPLSEKNIKTYIMEHNPSALIEYLKSSAKKEYIRREKETTAGVWRGVVRYIFLTVIDLYFSQHLSAIDDLRQGIGLRGYANVQPLAEYKNEAFKLFERLIQGMYFEATRRMFGVQIETHEHAHRDSKQTEKGLVFSGPAETAQFAEPLPKAKPGKSEPGNPGGRLGSGSTIKKIGRNDPCHCGSGKKYKKCHYPN